MRRRHLVTLGIALAVLLGLVAAWRSGLLTDSSREDASATAGTQSSPATYVGSTACRDCHADEYQRWQASQHAAAMLAADEGNVLGDFSGVKVRHGGVESEFLRRDGSRSRRWTGWRPRCLFHW